MEDETPWISHSIDDSQNATVTFNSFADEADEEVSTVSIDLILPDDLLERIISYLPVASIFRAGSVSKRWHKIVSSKRFLWNNSAHLSSQKPWYFMFTSSDEPIGYAYDPTLRKWYNIDLPCIETSDWFVSSSYSLVSFMDNDSRSKIFVCNPITQSWKGIPNPPSPKFPDYGAMAISTDQKTHEYNISLVKSKQVSGNFFQWHISIHIYSSGTTKWATVLTEILSGWRGGDESVICNGVLYFIIYSTGGIGSGPDDRHGLVTYNLQNQNGLSKNMVMIEMPCALTCGRLMNMKERLVLVGGIGKKNRPGIIKGIGIWGLKGKEWEEMGRMPQKYFQGFGEFDDVFASSGAEDLVYIQSYGAPALLVFDVKHKVWKWAQKCPVLKKFPLQLFTGFCFQPGLQIQP